MFPGGSTGQTFDVILRGSLLQYITTNSRRVKHIQELDPQQTSSTNLWVTGILAASWLECLCSFVWSPGFDNPSWWVDSGRWSDDTRWQTDDKQPKIVN